jgi:hypothetical protein
MPSRTIRSANSWRSVSPAYWRERLAQEWGLDSCLELQFERHYRRFLMPDHPWHRGGQQSVMPG